MKQDIQWPKKTRELKHCIMDSTIWNDFNFRDDDIIVATWQKSGTTWLQQIIAQLVFQGKTEGIPISEVSPWVDMRLPPPELRPDLDLQTHRRFLKTHLPADALVYSPKAKYVYIARDGRDCLWSLYNHHHSLTPELYEALKSLPNIAPVFEPPEIDNPREYFLAWLKDQSPWWSFWESVRTFWGIRELPNMYLLHFQNLKDDLEGEMRRLAHYLNITIDESMWEQMVYQSSFEFMKKDGAAVPLGGAIFKGGVDSFIHKGGNNRWRDALSSEDVAAYEERALHELGPDCAHWLETGEMQTQ